jgi:uncharacterized membrane protein YgcG
MARGILGFLATLIVVGLLVSVGAGIYQAGVAQGIVDAGRFPAAATVPVAGTGYGYGWHGPDLFGLLIGLFFLFILFRIIGGAFFGWRGRGWGHHGYGYGPGWGRGYGPGDSADAPRSWREAREQRMADWHRDLHDQEGKGSGGSSGGASGGGSGGGTSPA